MYRILPHLLLIVYCSFAFGGAVGEALHIIGHIIEDHAYHLHHHHHEGAGHDHHAAVEALLTSSSSTDTAPNQLIIGLLLNIIDGITAVPVQLGAEVLALDRASFGYRCPPAQHCLTVEPLPPRRTSFG